jgi:hypothetical protein
MKHAYYVLAIALSAVLLTVVSASASPCRSYDHGGMTASPICQLAALTPHRLEKPRSKRHTRKRMRNEYTPSRMVKQQVVSNHAPARYGHRYNAGPKPGRWCGWWMRTQFGGGPEYNVAWNWRKRGIAARPHVGAVVVWRHHVAYITGRTANGAWIVKSGNDGGRVRERVRSLSGAVIRAL